MSTEDRTPSMTTLLCMVCLDEHVYGDRDADAIRPAVTIYHGNAECLEHVGKAARWPDPKQAGDAR